MFGSNLSNPLENLGQQDMSELPVMFLGKNIRQARKENARKVLKEIEDMKEKKWSDYKRGKQKTKEC